MREEDKAIDQLLTELAGFQERLESLRRERSHAESRAEESEADAAQQHTERERAEKALRAAEERYRMLVESVEDYAIFMLDPEGKVASWNPGAQKLKGYREDEIIGKPYETFFFPEDVAAGKPRALLKRAAEEGHVEVEGWRVRKDGSRFWASAVISAIRDEDGELVGYSKVTRDLTERLERDRVQAEYVRRLEEMDRFKDDFLAIISHELRTPLNFIMGFGSFLEDSPDLAPQHKTYVSKMVEGADRMLAIVNDLLEVARIQAGKFHIEPEPVYYRSVVNAVLSTLSPLAAEKGVALSAEIPESLSPELDPARITQVLTNLVGNAIKFTPSGGRVTISAEVQGDALVTDVRDTGVGIAPEYLDTIFERFAQVDMSNTRRTGGVGLGLAITRAIVEAHGGMIGVESQLSRGSRFWFSVPLVVKQAKNPAASS